MVENKTVNRDSHGRLIKGSVLNPGGNKHTKNIDDLIDALEHRAKQQNYKDFNAYVAKKCFEDTTVLIAVLKKIYPAEIQGDGLKQNVIIQIIRPETNSPDTDTGIHIQRASVAKAN